MFEAHGRDRQHVSHVRWRTSPLPLLTGFFPTPRDEREAAMSRLLNKRSHSRTEAQAFFAEVHRFPRPVTALTCLGVADVAVTLLTILSVS
jgi:hypothetical protein